MTLAEVKTMLAGTNIPVAFRKFETDDSTIPEVPYMVYYTEGARNFYADGIVYSSLNRIVVELYTTVKDQASEAKLEAAFANNSIKWTKDEQYYGSEDILETSYRFDA